MRRVWPKLFSLFAAAVAVTLICPLPYAFASSGRELVKTEKKLEDLEKRIRQTEESIESIVSSEGNILGELENLALDLVRIRRKKAKAEARLKRIEGDIFYLNVEIKTLEKERASLTERLNTRLRAIYKMRFGGVAKVLFASDSSRDLARRYKYMSIIMESDRELIEQTGLNLRTLNKRMARLGLLREEHEETKNEAAKIKRVVERGVRVKQSLLKNVKRKKSRHIDLLEELDAAKDGLTGLITSLRRKRDFTDVHEGFGALKGSLDMPVEGTVVAGYGKVLHPKFKTETFNNGIVIEAPVGTPVRCVYDGKVIYVGWLKGYGQVMIFDHGGGYYTLFGYLNEVLKSRGESVTRGEDVAKVGDSGAHDSPALYFEIRQRGVPRDPIAWIAGR